MRPPRDLQKTDRTCPKCGTTFGAVADLCKCINCGHAFHASRIRTKQVEATVQSDDARLIATVVSNADPDVIAYVERSITDPKGFYKSNKRQFRDWETSFDVDPIYVAIHKLLKLDYIGCIDWREPSNEIGKIIKKLMAKRSLGFTLQPFENTTDEESAGHVLKTISLQFVAYDITLCLFNMFSDEYIFGLLSNTAFEEIKHFSYPDFQIANALELQ